MSYDFDDVIDRRSTDSNKWRKYPADVLPLCVADMDFRSPEPVVRALRERVEHGVFGYRAQQPEFYEVFLARLDPFTFFLDQARVALNDGKASGRGGEGFARLNFACRRAILGEALDRMRHALERRA